MSEYILGIDLGTTSLKTAVYDHEGVLQDSALEEYSLLTPQVNVVEADCNIYIDAITKCMDRLYERGKVNTKNITAIGFSVQGETLILLDENNKPLKNAIVWMDNSAGKQAEELRKKFGDEMCYEVTGQVSFEACWPAAKLLMVKENEPEVFKKIKHILLLEDYIIFLLTGRYVAEGSLLTSTEYWDIRSKKYWKEMLDYIGIDEQVLPKIMESGEQVGKINRDMAEKLHISSNAAVCTGCLDQAAGAIGVGNIKPGIFSENIGAALAVCVPTKTLTYDKNRQMPVHYFATRDTYMMHTFTTGGMCLRWFRDEFCNDEIYMQKVSGIDSYYIMDKEAERILPGSDGLITLPHLQGSMAPDVNLKAKGVFYGLTLQHTKAHIIRSIMESLGYIICRNLEAVSAMGIEIEQIRTMGGGSKSDIWNQIKADITGKELNVTYSSQDTACLGAAILAGKACGIFSDIDSAVSKMVRIKKTFKPDAENHKIYEQQYKKFKVLFSSLQEIYAME